MSRYHLIQVERELIFGICALRIEKYSPGVIFWLSIIVILKKTNGEETHKDIQTTRQKTNKAQGGINKKKPQT